MFRWGSAATRSGTRSWTEDRKSTRLNSSHSQISYAVFCLKKKKKIKSSQKGHHPHSIKIMKHPCPVEQVMERIVDILGLTNATTRRPVRVCTHHSHRTVNI